MWDILGGLISGGSSLIGGIMGNNSQQEMARQNNQWNFLMQLQNQAFQMGMSSSAYQRGVADMKAAGLNPAMMFGGSGGPASTPPGSMSSGTMPIVRDVIGPAVDSAMRAFGLKSEVALREADVENRQATNSLIQQQTQKTADEAANVRADTTLKTLEVAPKKLQGALVQSMIEQNRSSARQAESQAAELSARQGKYTSDIEKTRAETESTRARTDYFRKFGTGNLTNFGDWGQAITSSAHGFARTLDTLRGGVQSYPQVLDRNNTTRSFRYEGDYYNQP